MRKLLLAIVMVLGCQLHAQIKVKINDKLITETTVLKAEEIQKMEVAFDKPKKLSYYGTGRLYLWVEFIGEKGEVIEGYSITKDGTNSVESFLADVNTFHVMPSDTNPKSEFRCTNRITVGYGINAKLMYIAKNYGYKTVKFMVSLGFRDKVGYEKYGDFVSLLKQQTYTIDNTALFTIGQKEKEQEKMEKDAKDAEKAKSDEAAKKAAEEEEKKGKGKKVLKKVLGW